MSWSLVSFSGACTEKPYVAFSCWSSIITENDFFAQANSDRNYTYSLAINWTNKEAEKHILFTDWIQKKALSKFGDKYDSSASALQVGVVAFTPEYINTRALINYDRPYANLVYAQSDSFRYNSDTSVRVTFTYGVMGTTIGGVLQESWHELLRSARNKPYPKDPLGWDHQVADGGELTAALAYGYYKRINPDWLPKQLDIVASSEASAGFYTNAGASFGFRLGRNVRNGTPHSLHSDLFPVSYDKFVDEPHKPSSYFFAGGKILYIAYNAFLECGYTDGEFCLRNSEIENEVIEWAAGYRLGFQKRSWVFALRGRSKEHSLPNSHRHKWGSLTYQRHF